MSDISFPGGNESLTGTQLHFSRLEELQRRVGSATGDASTLTPAQREEFAKAAQGFESMFINMMMKQMRESMLDPKDKEEESLSFGADTLEGFTDLQFADYAVKQGGLGLAQQVYKYLTNGEQLPMTTQHTGVPSPLTAPQKTGATDAAAQTQQTAPRGNFMQRVADRMQPYQDIITRASQTYDVPESLIKGIITAESAGNPNAQSGAGAKGLMQLMDGTARDMGVKNPFDPEQNIMGGTRYIQKMLSMFDGDESVALAAYNAGPGNVQKYDGIPPFSETQAYVRNVTRYTEQYRASDTA